MTLQDIELEIRSAIPDAGVIAISHGLTTNCVGETWNGQVYAHSSDDKDSLDVLIANANLCRTPEGLITAIIRSYDPESKTTEIVRLKAKLERLGVRI